MKNKYFIYCRKSSEEETKQVQSLETQETELIAYATKNNLQIVQVFKESKSAKDDGNRPLFAEMLKRVRTGEANAILVLHTDRLSRNFIEAGKITKLFDEGTLVEIRTPTQTFNLVHDMVYMGIDFVFASHYSRNLSVRVKEGIKTKLSKGEFPSYAPLGYLNKDSNIVPDPARANYIVRAFKMYASGDYSIPDIANILYEEGFRSRAGNKVTKSSVHRILHDPVYYGVIQRKGKLYKGSYESILDKSLYDSVQDVFSGKNKARPKKPEKRYFLYRKYLKCDVCGCSLTATLKKSKYKYYYCTNGKHVCDQHKDYIREKDLEEVIYEELKEFKLDKEKADISFQAYKWDLINRRGNALSMEESLQSELTTIDKKLKKLLDKNLDDKISDELYDEKEKELKNERVRIESALSNSKEVGNRKTLELLENVKNFAVSVDKLFIDGEDPVKKHTLDSLLWNFNMRDKEIASVLYKQQFARMAKLQKTDDFEIWREARSLIRTLVLSIDQVVNSSLSISP
ncbi:MAG: recombinase family protein, partial [Tissierellales bacterium]|nr:recombinase family protein [Tissierellales bacterium]